ncbi:MAG: MBL fold metallo-hydrolase [Rhodobacteraceae bacterium]|nr:MBL fold metallo-hydrolase [Paracoccaceae bacterium]
MTHRGTNSYVVGTGRVAVIDPGPAMRAHLDAILAALDPGEVISHIFVTHSHLDHSPLAAPLSEATGAPIHAFGDSLAGRSALMNDLATAGLAGGGEGVDAQFLPHEHVGDEITVDAGDWQLTAIWTPGHFGNHLSFAHGDAVFSGDHVMGWASTMVSPPDGDLTAFMASTQRLAARGDRVFYPGHGAPITDPVARSNWLLAHRRSRETEILDRLDEKGTDIASLTRDIYTDAPPGLQRAAERNVFAHLIDLHQTGRVNADPELRFGARFFRLPEPREDTV